MAVSIVVAVDKWWTPDARVCLSGVPVLTRWHRQAATSEVRGKTVFKSPWPVGLSPLLSQYLSGSDSPAESTDKRKRARIK